MKASSHNYAKEESMEEDRQHHQIQNYPIEKAELQQLVDEHLQGDDAQTASFWAEKVLAMDGPRKTLEQRLPQIAEYLSVLTAARSWQTIITLIERHDLLTKHLIFAFFHVNALFNRDMFSEIISLPIGYLCRWDDVPFIAPDSSTFIYAESEAVRDSMIKTKLDELCKKRKYEARLLFLLAKTYLMVQNRPAAAGCLRHCLASNPFCNEALHLAIDSRLLKTFELQEIVSNSNLPTCNPSGMRIMHHLLEIYDLNQEPSNCSKIHNSTSNIENSSSQTEIIDNLLSTDLSFQSAYAFRLYNQGSIQQAYDITSAIMHEFGYYSKCFLVHIGCLVHLNKVSELFQLGHSMVNLKRELEITWYTVGCYYYATGQFTTAKKFLNKCTTMNSGFGEGWLAYGHTLFYVEEHEQAMNCYLRASRILECHFEPLLYTAVEYCFANNFKLATDFLHDAEMVAGANAIVLHEQGTIAYMEHEFRRAEKVLLEALRLITKRDISDPLESLLNAEVSNFWEPLFNNLGHTLRKLGKYEQAILVHRKSLLLSTTRVDAWTCIGVCYASMISHGANMRNNINAAMESLNKALTLRPGDDLVKMALEKVMQFAAEQTSILFSPILDAADENLDALIEKRKEAKQLKKQELH